MKVIITGAAGFIGSELVNFLINNNIEVIGIDNHNNYYDVELKENRIKRYSNNNNYTHYRVDIANMNSLKKIVANYRPDIIVNLAAQAGVRYSITNPEAYIKSNIVGFANILECCRIYKVPKLIYASSSSVYGDNEKVPFKESNNTDRPLSLYASTKKSNELMAYSYSKLYGIETVGLRLFTVYGPWGRPDMSLFKFTDLITNNKPIEIYGHGEHKRDFTYISDVIEAISKIINTDLKGNKSEIYNIGNSTLVKFNEYIELIEKYIGRKAVKVYLPRQLGDMHITYADNHKFYEDYKLRPKVQIEEGIRNFVHWYLGYKR